MKNDQYGFLYVDHTHSCYPLVLYPEEFKQNKSRASGFFQAAKDVGLEKGRIISLNPHSAVRS